MVIESFCIRQTILFNPHGERMGRITEISVDDVVEVVEEAGEPCGSAEVAEALGCHQRTAWEKLNLAVEQGDLYSKKIHRNCKVYWS